MELPKGYTLEEASFLTGDGNTDGLPYAYWSCWAKGPSGKYVGCGQGDSKNDAMQIAIAKCVEHFRFHSQSPQDRLREYIKTAKQVGRFYDCDLIDIIEILSGALLK